MTTDRVLGRPLIEALFYSYTNGIGMALCMCSLVFTLIRKKLDFKPPSLLLYAGHFFAMVHMSANYYSIIFTLGCSAAVISVYAYSIADTAVDAYIFITILYLIEPNENERKKRYAWYVAFFIGEIVARLFQYIFLRFIPLSNVCQLVLDPRISLGSTLVKTLFLISMLVPLFLSVNSKAPVVASVGKRSVVGCIFLIIIKISLFLPYGFSPFGVFSAILLNIQLGIQSCILDFLLLWKPKGISTKMSLGLEKSTVANSTLSQ
jgi:hypothetical protein